MPLVRAELKRKHHQLRNVLKHDISQVLYLPFDKDDGNYARDRSGYNNHGTIHGATRVAGKIGDASSFDGVNDYVRVPNSASLQLTSDLTISLWVYVISIPAHHSCLIAKYWNGEFGFYAFDDGRVDFAHGAPNETLTVLPAGSVTTGQWIHLAVTRNMTSMKLTGYKNGEAGAPVTFTITTPIASTYPVDIGIELGEYWPLNGLIDEVRIYNKALNQAEIQRIMNMRGL